MRREFGKEIFWSQTSRSWKIWTRQKFMLGASLRKRSSCRKVVTISHSRSELDQSSRLEERRCSENPPQSRITLHVEKSTTMFFDAESDGSPPSNTLADDSEARNDVWTIARNCIHRRHVEARVTLCVKKQNHSQYHFKTESIHTSQRALQNEKTPEIHKRDPEKTYCPGRVAGKAY